MRRHRRRARQQLARGRGQIRRSVPGPVLQIERNADHHRPAFAARLQECVAYRDRHALGHVQAVIGGARRGDERRLVDLLVVPAAFQRRFPGEHHQRQMGAHGRRQRRDQLRHAGPAGDGRHAHVPALSRVRHGGGERAMLVPDIDHAASLLGQPRGPVHVRIAEEREAGAHVLLHEGLRKDVVHAGLGFTLHRLQPPLLGGTTSPGRNDACFSQCANATLSADHSPLHITTSHSPSFCVGPTPSRSARHSRTNRAGYRRLVHRYSSQRRWSKPESERAAAPMAWQSR